jgi:hypothetical protein
MIMKADRTMKGDGAMRTQTFHDHDHDHGTAPLSKRRARSSTYRSVCATSADVAATRTTPAAIAP